MKKSIVLTLIGLSAITLLTGCIGLSIGSDTTAKPTSTTMGQELMDLQKAKESGAITEAEYQTQKAKILNNQ